MVPGLLCSFGNWNLFIKWPKLPSLSLMKRLMSLFPKILLPLNNLSSSNNGCKSSSITSQHYPPSNQSEKKSTFLTLHQALSLYSINSFHFWESPFFPCQKPLHPETIVISSTTHIFFPNSSRNLDLNIFETKKTAIVLLLVKIKLLLETLSLQSLPKASCQH